MTTDISLSAPGVQELKMPSLAESVVEGEILGWLIAEGDRIEEGQAVLEVMTDKVTVELPAPFAGVVRQRLVNAGDVVAVGATLALVETGAVVTPATPPAPTSTEPGTGLPQAEAKAGLREERSIIEASGAAAEDPALAQLVFAGWRHQPARSTWVAPAALTRERVLAVPAARKLARERGVNLADVPGSGPNSTVRQEDVFTYLTTPTRVPQAASAAPAPIVRPEGATPGSWPPPAPAGYRTPAGYEALEDRTPFRGSRRAVSQALQASLLYTAQTHTIEELDCTELISLRGELRADAASEGVKLSYLPFFFKAVAVALHDFPALNSSLDEVSGEVVRKRFVHLGMAVNTDAGLIVPVLHDVDRKSVLALGRESADLAERARAGTLRPQEMQDATFTVSNIGAVGAMVGFPIVNTPAVGILSLHSITKRPIAVEREGEDVVVVRPMMYLTLGFDHRLVDGADAARFNRRVVALLERPRHLMLNM